MNTESRVVSGTIWARGGKRIFDVIAAVVLLVILSPMLVIVAGLIKLADRGPLFFSQDRGGRNGVIFRLVKFRTMRAGRKPDPKELVPLDHGDITPIGRVLRRLNIDELPQLINVLKGEMSLIGPRPTLPDQVAAYDDFRRQRLLLPPGITGLAQVYSSAALPWDERILFDIAYVRRCSLAMDLGVLARTALVLVLGEARTARAFDTTRFARYVTPPPGYADGARAST